MAPWVDYIITVVKSGKKEFDGDHLSHISPDILISGRKSKLITNPIYRIISRSKDGVHLWRKRENNNREYDKWELECLMMMKAMPLQIFLPLKVVQDIKNNRCSAEILTLAERGVIIEVPEYFI